MNHSTTPGFLVVSDIGPSPGFRVWSRLFRPPTHASSGASRNRHAPGRGTPRFLGSSLLLEHGQDIARWVLEPGDQRSPTAKDPHAVRFECAFVALEAHAALGQPLHGLLNVGDGEIEDGEGC